MTLSQSCVIDASMKASGLCTVGTGGHWGGDSAELVQGGAHGVVPGGVLMLPGRQVEPAAAAASEISENYYTSNMELNDLILIICLRKSEVSVKELQHGKY